jgi:hypothetical protein
MYCIFVILSSFKAVLHHANTMKLSRRKYFLIITEFSAWDITIVLCSKLLACSCSLLGMTNYFLLQETLANWSTVSEAFVKWWIVSECVCEMVNYMWMHLCISFRLCECLSAMWTAIFCELKCECICVSISGCVSAYQQFELIYFVKWNVNAFWNLRSLSQKLIMRLLLEKRWSLS